MWCDSFERSSLSNFRDAGFLEKYCRGRKCHAYVDVGPRNVHPSACFEHGSGRKIQSTNAYNTPRHSCGQELMLAGPQIDIALATISELWSYIVAIERSFSDRKWESLHTALKRITGLGEFYSKEIALGVMTFPYEAIDRRTWTPCARGVGRVLIYSLLAVGCAKMWNLVAMRFAGAFSRLQRFCTIRR